MHTLASGTGETIGPAGRKYTSLGGITLSLTGDSLRIAPKLLILCKGEFGHEIALPMPYVLQRTERQRVSRYLDT